MPDELGEEGAEDSEGSSDAEEEEDELTVDPSEYIDVEGPPVYKESADGIVSVATIGGQPAGIYVYFTLPDLDSQIKITKAVVTDDGSTLKITASPSYVSPGESGGQSCRVYTYSFEGFEKITRVEGADSRCYMLADEVED